MNIFEIRAKTQLDESALLAALYPNGLPEGVIIRRVLPDAKFGGIVCQISTASYSTTKYVDTIEQAYHFEQSCTRT